MDNHQAREFVEAVYRDIWAAKDLEKFDTYYHPDMQFIGYQPDGGEAELNYQMVKNHADNSAKDRKDVVTKFEEVYAVAEHEIIARFHQRSVYLANGHVLNLRTVFKYELKEHKIYRGWAFFNMHVPFYTK
jgi:ketosteroid isomerase-like protein